jgi:hypothetical protein
MQFGRRGWLAGIRSRKMAGDARTPGGPEACLAAELAVEREHGRPLVAGHARWPGAPEYSKNAA